MADEYLDKDGLAASDFLREDSDKKRGGPPRRRKTIEEREAALQGLFPNSPQSPAKERGNLS